MPGSNAIKEFLVGLGFEVLAIATFIFLLLRHLSFSPVIEFSLPDFEGNPASEVIISPIILSGQKIEMKVFTDAVLPTHPPRMKVRGHQPPNPLIDLGAKLGRLGEQEVSMLFYKPRI